MKKLNRFSFGATSSITTSLSLIVGLDATAHPKASILSALAVLAIADNISDSLGIHIFRESEDSSQPKIYTITNFLTRFAITFIFAGMVIFLKPPFLQPAAVVLGMLVLSVLTYGIAREQGFSPWKEIPKHLLIATVAMIASHLIGQLIRRYIG